MNQSPRRGHRQPDGASRNRVSTSIDRFLIWCCGADPSLIKSTAERRWYHSLGVSIIITALLAGASLVLLVRTGYPKVPGLAQIAGGVVWAVVVFNIDRLIVSKVMVDPSRSSKTYLFVARLLLATVIAILIAEGIELTTLEPEVRKQIDVINEQNVAEQNKQKAANLKSATELHQSELDAVSDKATGLKTAEGDALDVYNAQLRILKCESQPDAACQTGTGIPGPGADTRDASEQVTIARNDYNAAHDDYTAYTQTAVPISFTPAQLVTCGLSPTTKALTPQSSDICQIRIKIQADATKNSPSAKSTTDGLLLRLEALSDLAKGSDGATVWAVRILLFAALILIDLIPLTSKMFGGTTGHDQLVRDRYQKRTKHFLDRDLPGGHFAGMGWGAAHVASKVRNEYYRLLFNGQVRQAVPTDDAPDAHQPEPQSRAPRSQSSSGPNQQARRSPLPDYPANEARQTPASGTGRKSGTPSGGAEPVLAPVFTEPERDSDAEPAPEKSPPVKHIIEGSTILLQTQEGNEYDLRVGQNLSDIHGNVNSNYDLFLVSNPQGKELVAKCTYRNQNSPQYAGLHRDTLAAAVRHPNIIAVSDEVYQDLHTGAFLILMPYYTHGDLAGPQASSAIVTVNDAVNVLRHVMEGLSEVHRSGIAHLDIKPQNILVAFDDAGGLIPIVTDFGISKVMDAQSQIVTQVFQGTTDYAPIEQLVPGSVYGKRTFATDLWACAAVLYRTLTGFPPRRNAEILDGMNRVEKPGEEYQKWLISKRPEPTPLNQILDVPSDLSDLVQDWLTTDPQDRIGAIDSPDNAMVLPHALERLNAITDSGPNLDTPIRRVQ